MATITGDGSDDNHDDGDVGTWHLTSAASSPTDPMGEIYLPDLGLPDLTNDDMADVLARGWG
ncbi:hypothetical protein [Streptomyces beihaiensis]|uniref:Uncharacterized protein n=1 Tax=Streptomyces beihaiensis TaxID=2984495 RepID=A0ABT3TPW9_9ACTN|nr:hypothetical protein [Streptomyces beihaiensis]MCX3058561.1 hypothetical protein [Streptomyces beihaiensis]